MSKELLWLEQMIKEGEEEKKVETLQLKSGYHVNPLTGKLLYVEPKHKVVKRIKKKRKLKYSPDNGDGVI
jgi:hypothetical protein